MPEIALEQLKQTISRNCHISDAQYAGNYTLCIYLLKMREFYRWEKQIPFSENLSNDDIGQWLMEREAWWDTLEEEPFSELHINGKVVSCYEAELVNSMLEPDRLVYSGGYGNYGKPVFFLADLESQTRYKEYQLYICGHEYARELAAPPGMSQNRSIYIRKESLKRFIWEKYEESHWYNTDNPLAKALACYNFEQQPENSLEQMASLEADTILYHEIGEIESSRLLGPQWSEMVMQMPRSKSEFMARAVKDHIADALSTLPRLIENKDDAQIHFYFANFKGMRREIFPLLLTAYQQWLSNKNLTALKQITEQSEQHWLDTAQKMLEIFEQKGRSSLADIETLVQENIL